jgi:hypothetical protein
MSCRAIYQPAHQSPGGHPDVLPSWAGSGGAITPFCVMGMMNTVNLDGLDGWRPAWIAAGLFTSIRTS